MRTARLAIVVAAATALIPLTASGAFAAPPSNDTPDGAIAMTLGQTVNQDTTQATTDSSDATLNGDCGAPFTNASVWYSYTPSVNGTFLLDMSQSDYTGGFMVFQGAPTVDSFITCGPTSIGVDGSSGTMYTIMAFSDTATIGGNLVLSLTKGPPAPQLKVTINPNGKVFSDGSASLSGTFMCKHGDYADIEGQLTQIWRRVKITAFFDEFVQGLCDGQVHSWKQKVVSDNGLFAKGGATLTGFTESCGLITCTDQKIKSQTITLAPAGHRSASSATSSTMSTYCSSGRGSGLYASKLGCKS